MQTEQEDEKKAEENKSPLQYEEPKTEEEVEKEKMGKISEIANHENEIDTISSVRNKVDGKIRVLYSEMELSAQSGGNVEAKLKQIAELEQKSNDLAGQIAERTEEVVEKLADNNKVEDNIVVTKEEIEEQKAEAQEQNSIEGLRDKTDQVKEDRLSI